MFFGSWRVNCLFFINSRFSRMITDWTVLGRTKSQLQQRASVSRSPEVIQLALQSVIKLCIFTQKVFWEIIINLENFEQPWKIFILKYWKEVMIETEIHFKLVIKHKLLAEYNSKHNHLRLYMKRWWLTTKQGTQIL